MSRYEETMDFLRQLRNKNVSAQSAIVGELSSIAGSLAIMVDGLTEFMAQQRRREAKAPYLEGDGYADGCMVYDTWRCPYCDRSYETEFERFDYCPHCGQAIDWEEEEKE